MTLVRDITCWYCQRDRHGDCFSRRICACRVCFAICHEPEPEQIEMAFLHEPAR
jgi:hypothetical protein